MIFAGIFGVWNNNPQKPVENDGCHVCLSQKKTHRCRIQRKSWPIIESRWVVLRDKKKTFHMFGSQILRATRNSLAAPVAWAVSFIGVVFMFFFLQLANYRCIFCQQTKTAPSIGQCEKKTCGKNEVITNGAIQDFGHTFFSWSYGKHWVVLYKWSFQRHGCGIRIVAAIAGPWKPGLGFCEGWDDWDFSKQKRDTLPETNIAPENWWLEDEFPFGMAYIQGLC